MPYTTDTLPEPVAQLPKQAQSIWLSVFNSSFRTFAGSDAEKEQASFIAAWGAVRSKFTRDTAGDWTAKSALSFEDPHGIAGRWTRAIKFTPNLLEASKRITYGEVYTPWTVDAQGDFADEGTIEDAAHAFLKHFGTIGEQHKLFGGKGAPVESFTTRAKDGDFPVPGTWVLGTQWSEEMWQKILNGEITGYSLGGDWTRMPLVAGREFVKSIRGGVKSALPELAELDDALFEQTVNAGPRIISQIVGLSVDEVSGVSLPANRESFKLFKSVGGGKMKAKAFVVDGGKCDCQTAEGLTKASPGSPWQKLYENYIQDGMTPEKARAEVERVLGPAPQGTWQTPAGKAPAAAPAAGDAAGAAPMQPTISFADVAKQVDALVGQGNGVAVASLIQAKYPAGPDGGIALPEGATIEEAIQWAVDQGTTAGIFTIKELAAGEEQVTLLKQIKNAIKSVAQRLGVKAEDPEEEEEAMTIEERKEMDELKAMVSGLGEKFAKAFPAPAAPAAPADPTKAVVPAVAEPVAAAAPDPKGGDGEYQPTPGELELHNRVKELEATIVSLQARPGTSDVAQVLMAPEPVEAGKSVGANGYRFSSIIGTAIPIGASNAVIAADMARAKRKQERRDSYGTFAQPRGR